MPLPENPSHEGNIHNISSKTFNNFEEFAEYDYVFSDEVVSLFISTYNAPPWNESWDNESATTYFKSLMELSTQVTTTREANSLTGFFIGSEGEMDVVVPLSLRAYFPEWEVAKQEEVGNKISQRYKDLGYSDTRVFWGCDFAVPPNRRGGFLAGRLLRKAIEEPIQKGLTTMYGMTMIGSPFHEITEKRGSKTLFEVAEIAPSDKRLFKAMNMKTLQ